jgi:hypothetical protein
MVERYGVGILFDETRPPQEIAHQVEEFLDDRPRYDAARQACLTAARVLNWEHEEQVLRGIYTGLGARAGLVVPSTPVDGHPSTPRFDLWPAPAQMTGSSEVDA